MSAYSDWKCGALSDEDYAFECWREAAQDKAIEDREFDKVFREEYNDQEDEE